MKRVKLVWILVLLLNAFAGYCLNIPVNPHLLNNVWDARWITHTEGLYSLNSTSVYLFRKTIQIEKIPQHFIIHVSADNRYKLFVNGKYQGTGPATSEPEHWYFDTYDIAKELKSGENIIAAEVWNWGDFAPWCQMSCRTAFIVQGDSERESVVNSNNLWTVRKCEAYQFFKPAKSEFDETTGVGPNENFSAAKYPYGWKTAVLSDDHFIPVSVLNYGISVNQNKRTYEWKLTPRPIPFMEESPQRFQKVIFCSDKKISTDFIAGEKVTIPAHSKIRWIIDQSRETCAYPVLKVSGGKNSKLKLIYTESVQDTNGNKVPVCESVSSLKGLYDVFETDGQSNREFTTLWYRTFRYVDLQVETDDEPLNLHDFSSIFNAYPFQLKATFDCNDPEINKIFQAGWLTGRLCAHENYVDCPYYERLQYLGDFPYSNPVTALLSGDYTLMRNAINQADWSRKSDELTFCAYPGKSIAKIIPQFSLAWIDMIYNYYQFTGDISIIKEHNKGIKEVLNWYKDKLNEQNMLGPMPYWNFVDCNSQWPWAPDKAEICEPTGTKTGNSALLTLQFAYALKKAKVLMTATGDASSENQYSTTLDKINQAVYELCYDSTKKYVADTPDRNSFSQHTNILASCTGCVRGTQAQEILRKLMHDDSLIQASMQFRAYYHIALTENNLAQNYLSELGEWCRLIREGFTTFPEYPEKSSRSYCHAWNAFPSYELLTIVCGLRATNAGMTSFEIEPHPGNLKWLNGSLPLKDGNISIELTQNKHQKLTGEVFIPVSVTARLHVNGKIQLLKPGKNRF